MSPLIFYREQAARQRAAAEEASLENVRERCQRASDAWAALAVRTERADNGRRQAATDKLSKEAGETLDREFVPAGLPGDDV